MKTARRHSHRAQAVALAQDHAQVRHAQMRRSNEHARNVPHLRLFFHIGPDHEAGCIHQTHNGQAVRVAQLHEARRLVGRVGIDRAAQVRRVVGQQTHRSTFDAAQRGVNAHTKARAQHEHAVHIGDALHGGSGVIHTQAVLGHHLSQGLGGWGLPR